MFNLAIDESIHFTNMGLQDDHNRMVFICINYDSIRGKTSTVAETIIDLKSPLQRLNVYFTLMVFIPDL